MTDDDSRRIWIDHIVLAVPDLDDAVARLTVDWGITPTAGGSHIGRGTRNALLALGGQTYLEIIGPDPEQPDPDQPRSFGVDERTGHGSVAAFAVGTNDIDALVKDLGSSPLDPGPVFAMSRARPDGVRIDWRLTNHVETSLLFFIDWGSTESPSLGCATGVTLRSLRVESPDARALQQLTGELHLGIETAEASTPSLEVVLSTPAGEVTLKS